MALRTTPTSKKDRERLRKRRSKIEPVLRPGVTGEGSPEPMKYGHYLGKKRR
jgi:hypothetical protein